MKQKMKSTTLLLMGFGLLLSASCGQEGKVAGRIGEQAQPPNVILILADDQGWGDLGHHGNTNLQTPHLDALAANGVSFTQFFVQPVCSPTRAELLTGRFFTDLGVHGTSAGGERMDTDVATLADVLKNAGYRTAAFGKWHNGMQPPYHPNARGFEEYYGFASGHWGNYFSPVLEHNGALVQGQGFLADDLTDHSIRFMEKNRASPFFIYLPLNTPHSPMQVPDAHWNNFKGKDLALKHKNPEMEDLDFTRAALAMVENIDGNVGRLMEKMNALGLAEETIVIYLSDNGPNGWRWNGGLRGRKGSTDDGGVKTPFFMQWKDHLKPGLQLPHIASALDVTPTLLSLLGLEAKAKGYDGRDLSPLITGTTTDWEDHIIYNHWDGRTSVRTQRYRLDHENQLYDMVLDPGQEHDMGAELPQLRDSLIRAKETWLREHPPLAHDTDDRPFTLGHPDFLFTQLPARDGTPHGNIQRSNKYPNNTFFKEWTSERDSISWDVDVLTEGRYQVTLYYTLPQGSEGLELHLHQNNNRLSKKILEAHDPPQMGMEKDRVPRMESYVKDFKPLVLGTIALAKGRQPLVLKATGIPDKKGPDVRLMFFERLD